MTTGRFDIRELVVDASNTLTAFAADFEQHCEDSAAGLYGAIRYNSSISDLRPFAGNYPIYHLTVGASPFGRVTGSGIDCGAGSSTCALSLPGPVRVTLTATPVPGYFFTGWLGDCRVTPATTVHVNGLKTCTPLFEPIVTTQPRSLFWDGPPGNFPFGPSRQGVYSPLATEWSIRSSGNGNSIHIEIDDDPDYWRLDFAAPRTVAATRAPPAARPRVARAAAAMRQGWRFLFISCLP